VEDGVNGYLVPAGDAATLAARLAELLGAPERRATMGAHGRERVRAHFSFRSQGAHYERLLARMTAPRALHPVAVEA
jgi:colanic acid/amylovoran biosynthesis glycosyltransferase